MDGERFCLHNKNGVGWDGGGGLYTEGGDVRAINVVFVTLYFVSFDPS
jgi:hypothetical protein